MKPGTPVTNIEPLRDGPHTIPPGTLGIIEWCDKARGEAAVQFIGHILQRGVDVGVLQQVDMPPVTLRWLRADVDPELDASWAERVAARARAIGVSAEEAVERMCHMGVLDMPDEEEDDDEVET